jgi:glycosyltransferase involved in cell wall biosynthesis
MTKALSDHLARTPARSPLISFIIPAFNEERLVGNTVQCIHAAVRTLGIPYEVIVVDDASSDQTAAIAAQHGARVISVAHRQIAATRNAGARAALGDLLVFVDADTSVNESVVAAAIQAWRRGAVGGGAAVQFDGPLPLYAHLLLPLVVWIYRLARLASGCFLFCTRQAFAATGGFDESLFGAEELAMSQALKRQGRFVVLRAVVTTSGRKLRAYSAWEILIILARLSFRGWRGVQNRRGMELWYGERREDPKDAGRLPRAQGASKS